MSHTWQQTVYDFFLSPWLYFGVGLGGPFLWWAFSEILYYLKLPAVDRQNWRGRFLAVWAVRARLWFHARVPILLAAALLLFAPLSWRSAPGLLGNLFVLEAPYQFAVVSFMSMITALMILVTFRVTELNSQERFADFDAAMRGAFGQGAPDPPEAWSARRIVLAFVLAHTRPSFLPLAHGRQGSAFTLGRIPWLSLLHLVGPGSGMGDGLFGGPGGDVLVAEQGPQPRRPGRIAF